MNTFCVQVLPFDTTSTMTSSDLRQIIQIQRLMQEEEAKAGQHVDGVTTAAGVEEALEPLQLYNAIQLVGARQKASDNKFALYATQDMLEARITAMLETLAVTQDSATMKAQAAALKARTELRAEMEEEMQLKIQAMQAVFDQKLATVKTFMNAEFEKRCLADDTEAKISGLRESVTKTKKDVLATLTDTVAQVQDVFETQHQDTVARVVKLEREIKSTDSRSKAQIDHLLDAVGLLTEAMGQSPQRVVPETKHRYARLGNAATTDYSQRKGGKYEPRTKSRDTSPEFSRAGSPSRYSEEEYEEPTRQSDKRRQGGRQV